MTTTNDTRQGISREHVSNAMEVAGIAETVGTLNDSYSGRRMNGETCMSFVIDGHWGITRRLAKFFSALASMQAYEIVADDTGAIYAPTQAEELSEVVELDNLGMDTIVYFPGWKLDD